jgi:hypothetical protein
MKLFSSPAGCHAPSKTMEDPMGFERHVIRSVDTPLKAAPVVAPLHPADTSRATETLRLAREMRGEWRKERFSRLSGH